MPIITDEFRHPPRSADNEGDKGHNNECVDDAIANSNPHDIPRILFVFGWLFDGLWAMIFACEYAKIPRTPVGWCRGL